MRLNVIENLFFVGDLKKSGPKEIKTYFLQSFDLEFCKTFREAHTHTLGRGAGTFFERGAEKIKYI